MYSVCFAWENPLIKAESPTYILEIEIVWEYMYPTSYSIFVYHEKDVTFSKLTACLEM